MTALRAILVICLLVSLPGCNKDKGGGNDGVKKHLRESASRDPDRYKKRWGLPDDRSGKDRWRAFALVPALTARRRKVAT